MQTDVALGDEEPEPAAGTYSWQEPEPVASEPATIEPVAETDKTDEPPAEIGAPATAAYTAASIAPAAEGEAPAVAEPGYGLLFRPAAAGVAVTAEELQCMLSAGSLCPDFVRGAECVLSEGAASAKPDGVLPVDFPSHIPEEAARFGIALVLAVCRAARRRCDPTVLKTSRRGRTLVVAPIDLSAARVDSLSFGVTQGESTPERQGRDRPLEIAGARFRIGSRVEGESMLREEETTSLAVRLDVRSSPALLEFLAWFGFFWPDAFPAAFEDLTKALVGSPPTGADAWVVRLVLALERVVGLSGAPMHPRVMDVLCEHVATGLVASAEPTHQQLARNVANYRIEPRVKQWCDYSDSDGSRAYAARLARLSQFSPETVARMHDRLWRTAAALDVVEDAEETPIRVPGLRADPD